MGPKVAIVGGFLVAFAAGLTVGLQARTPVTAAPSPPPEVAVPATAPAQGRQHARGPAGWMKAELDLTPEQQAQLESIWGETARRGRGEQEDRRRQFRRERDEAIAALVPPEARPQYDQVQQEYADRTAALEREAKATFQAAVERTKQILTPPQRAKYEAVLQRFESERAARDRSRSSSDRGPATGPSSPAARP
jgi:Spy/CpxP family protein refolding chaperone